MADAARAAGRRARHVRAIGVAGASVIERYLAVAALALMVFAAVAFGGWTMLRPGRLRTAWMVGAVAIVRRRRRLHGDAPEPRRASTTSCASAAHAHDDLDAGPDDPQVQAGLRCGPLTRAQPQARPRLALDRRPAATTKVLRARRVRDDAQAAAEQGRRRST